MHDRDGYYAVLEHAQKGDGDITEWLEWFLDCMGRALTRSEGLLERVLNKVAFWRRHAEVSLSARQRKVLNKLLDAGPDGFEGGLNNRKYVGMTKASSDTAQRDLADLVAKGLLRPGPGGGRSASYEIMW